MEKIMMWKYYKLKTPIVREDKTFTEITIHPYSGTTKQITMYSEYGNIIFGLPLYKGNLKECREKVKELAVW